MDKLKQELINICRQANSLQRAKILLIVAEAAEVEPPPAIQAAIDDARATVAQAI